MHKILDFLDVPWNSTVLHHEKLVEMGDISLSKYVIIQQIEEKFY